MTPQQKELMALMAKEIRTQDNAITADPIFMVQQKERTYGFDVAYTDTQKAIYLDEDSEEVSEAERKEKYGEFAEEQRVVGTEFGPTYITFEEWCDENYNKTGYQDHWVNVQPFFTRVGAETYLRKNAHNLKSPRIYVESAFRNDEWQLFRQFLLEMPLVTEP